MSELKPCPNPWCGSTDIGIESDFYDSPPVHYTVCNACGNTGPARDTEEAAADVWNTRPKSEAEELLELLHDRRGSLHCYAASRCVVDYPDSDYVTERNNPLDALRAAREAMEDD